MFAAALARSCARRKGLLLPSALLFAGVGMEIKTPLNRKELMGVLLGSGQGEASKWGRIYALGMDGRMPRSQGG
jgi:hypothetical protein